MKKRFYLTYPVEQIKEPLLYEVGHRFKVVTNIRQASVSDRVGVVAIEIEGDSAEIERAIVYLKEKGVEVEPIELDIIE